MGGEKRLDAGHRNHTQGSPPRGRGKGGNLPGRVRPQGITPAWAGKSLRAGSTARPKGGSPPRGRGKGLRWSGYAQNHGITPALAGKRVGVAVSFQRFKDHPRVGGEKPAVPACCLKFPGSPPRWRGKVVVGIRLVRTPRITPALAGKSGSLCPQDRSRGDHPRVGGEKLVQLKLRAAIQGSPPRWRGKADHSPHGDPRSGITPALAGKRIVFSAGYASFEDHPRVGGEKLYCIAALFSIWGSPPRWRGKALLAKRRYGVIGITPALAGKSQ